MTVLREDAIAPLPDPVQRCLRRTGVIGKPIPSAVTVVQRGQIRTAPTSRWLRFTAREVYEVSRPGFEWRAALKIGGITAGRATDSLRAGRGRMHVKLLGLIPVVDAAGPEIDQGSLLRWLNETMWFPAVWATDLISWDRIDETSALGFVSVAGLSVSAEFRFDAEGRLVDSCAERYRSGDDGYELATWCTPLTKHTTFGGFELPSGGSAVWKHNDEEFEYIQIEATDVDYS